MRSRVYRVDLSTGRRELWKEFTPRDPTGISSIGATAVTADGKTFVYTYFHTLSDL